MSTRYSGETPPVTGDELSAQLLADGLLSEEQLAGAMHRALAKREEHEAGAAWQYQTQSFLKAYKRVGGDEPNPHAIEGWHEDFLEAAEKIVIMGAERPVQDELRQRLLQAAGIAYVYKMIDSYLIEGLGEEETVTARLRDIGIDPEALRTRFADVYREHGPAKDRQRPDEDFATFAEMADFWDGFGPVWDELVGTAVGPLYDEYKAAGFDLPVLGDDGLYDEER